MSNVTKLKELYLKYGLVTEDVYKHKHYTIITRTGIDKIMAAEKIAIAYNVIACQPDFAAVHAVGHRDSLRIETYGSAKHGGKTYNKETKKWVAHGNTDSWYVLEVAEKRAKSRIILMMTGFYELGAFAEDESEEFIPGSKKGLTAQEKADEIVRILDLDLVDPSTEEQLRAVVEKKDVKSYNKALKYLREIEESYGS